MVKTMVERTLVNTASGSLILLLAIFMLKNWFENVNAYGQDVSNLKTSQARYEEKLDSVNKRLDAVDSKLDKILFKIK